ncbi:large-conductance mechanosensitive channel [Staphylococcus piscifermentans]|uniref:Large-conductance mechanosensitive channel n=1 Tax=Staphylococcus piscifermentans TaxID=70258 RepID=A0A239U719_9STAP|nr:large conductance mechanosensitive channel protein MscL [Staphylococcus piscifermentans]RTX86575.1 large conductance mechanosensitive channel protein MscL [Staphylococcus piscifermentans]GEP83542.1 large-conductance mechanosensitive channel [Staphylococcus piscifermentans]SNV04874.1 large-conductance mechanosensitive channel [Staphylococcus piscifermentans]
MFKEFKEFAFKGNVLDLAVAVVMGAAFNKIVTSLVTYIIMPLIGLIFGTVDFAKNWSFMGIKYGLFVQSIIDFLIVAFALFIFVKLANTLMKKEEVEEAPEENIVLLTEIRDLLQQQNGTVKNETTEIITESNDFNNKKL